MIAISLEDGWKSNRPHLPRPQRHDAYLSGGRRSNARKAVAQTETRKSVRTEGKDPNVKTGRADMSARLEAPAPPTKGGPRTRSIWGQIHVDNRTPAQIETL